LTIRNGRVSRRLGAAALVALIGSLLAFASPSAALINDEAGTARFGGDNRYETAAAIATSPHWANDTSCTPDVVVVNGENFPDGLSASIYGDRILLVKQNSIPAATQAAIIALQDLAQDSCSGQVDLEVVGGPAAVSAEVVGQLTDITNGTGGYVDFRGRIFGADRYETAIAVAEDTYGSELQECLVLAVGDNFPDALAAGPLVDDSGCPLVLTAGDSLHPATAAYMAAEAADSLGFVYIIGGTAAIPASVETELFAMGLNTQRLGGANRYETAAAIADEINSPDWSASNRSVVLVNGNSFADALAAGTFASMSAVDGVLLLVNAGSIPSATAAWHVANCDSLGEDTFEDLPDDGDPATDETIYGTVFAIGGTAVISDDVLAGAGAATKCSDPIEVTSATISYENAQDQVCLVQNDLVLAEWTGPEDHDGPVLIPVPGSAADGLFPTITAVEIDGEGTAADEFPAEASFGEGTLNVDLGEDTDGMTQARFVEIWSSLPEAAATFTAVANSGPLFGPPLSGDSGVWVYCAAPSADVVFEMVFNQPVGDADDFGTTPYGVSPDFVDEEFACFEDSEFCEMFDIPLIFAILGNEFFGGGGFIDVLEEDGIDAFSASPLWGVGDADGNTVFTMTVSDVPSLIPWTAFAEECGGEEGSCETPFLAPGVVSNARGLVNECTWGELRASDAFTLSWTNIQSDEDCEFIFIE